MNQKRINTNRKLFPVRSIVLLNHNCIFSNQIWGPEDIITKMFRAIIIVTSNFSSALLRSFISLLFSLSNKNLYEKEWIQKRISFESWIKSILVYLPFISQADESQRVKVETYKSGDISSGDLVRLIETERLCSDI